ncbi:MAG: MarR family transcriptional regulator [Actinomycetota bacterium]|nr:MarR family transcriptional regulator [Actinomycetota bacterium]
MDTAAEVCAGTPEDLTWLFHRGAQRLRGTLDAVCRQEGLTDARDWIVLTGLLEHPGRTQLGLSHDLGVDKTTLTALIDRLEAKQLLIRRAVPDDRRARMPEITSAGAVVQAEVAKGRDAAEAALLANFTQSERGLLRELISRIADGSCMSESPSASCDS